jgi:predicted  nucleic acid-binding Zn-ribbon protein
MNTIDQVQNAIAEVESLFENVNQQINDKQKEIDSFEYSCSDDEYDEMLDDVHGDVEICGMSYSSSRALKELDPVAYRCGKIDYESDYDLDNCEEYNDLKDELESLEDQLSDLESELDELNDELESLENDE